MARDLKLFTFTQGSGLLLAVTDEFVQLVGLPAQQLIDRPVSDVVTLCGPAGPDQSMTWRDPQPVLNECRIHPAGEEALTLRLIVRADGREGQWQAAGVDISGILALVQQRRELQARLSLAVRASHMTMWRYDHARDHLVWDSQASHVLDVHERDLPTDRSTMQDWVPESQREAVSRAFDRIHAVGSGRCECLMPNEVQDRHLVFRGQAWDYAADGSSRRTVGVLEDITAERELEKQRQTIAAVDPLTGFGNRLAFDHALREDMRLARSTGRSVSVILLLVDRFGTFAAQVGSVIADQAVVTIGRTLAAAATESRLYRFDGASFALTVIGADPGETQRLMQAQLDRTAAVELRQSLGHSFATTAGCASWDGEAELKSAELLRRAERALHRAQEDGGARGYSYENSVIGHDELRDAVKLGMRDSEFTVRYQPLARLGDECIVGLQSQAWWNRPSGEILEPDAFMPAINSSDLARNFGRWMLREVAEQLTVWDRDELLSGVRVKVDVSPQHAAHPRLLDDIAWALNETGIDAARIEIGVPATTVRPPDANYDLLRDIKQLGVGLAVNDLDAGSFPFGELASVPVDAVTIDQRSITDHEAAHQGLGQLIIEAAHICGLVVVAVGVSSQAARRRLTQLHCDCAHGDFIAPSMSADAAATHAAARSAAAVSAGQL